MAALKEQGEIIVKINSRILEPAELKKLDKLEKEQIHQQAANNKGKGILSPVLPNLYNTRSFRVKGQQIFDTSAVSYFLPHLD